MYDVVHIRVAGGKGGNGAVSFRHEKYVPFGGPDGGDGGKGGNIIILADPSVTDFKALHNGGLYRAGDGENGKGQKKTGKQGLDRVITVPLGTVIYEQTDGEKTVIADLTERGARFTAASGGRGGGGNVHYATSTNQTPRLAQAGTEGEARTLFLEMRLIADVGIIGYPNAGKSSLLKAVSRAKPAIADYAFTTLEPELGMVEVGKDVFILTEIPGLIEGASQGKGLGHDFLRHSTRTRVFIHLIDGTAAFPVDNMVKVNNELYLYSADLLKHPQIVAVNKVDIPDVKAKVDQLKTDFTSAGIDVRFISAATGEGVKDLMKAVSGMLTKTIVEKEPTQELKVFRPQPRQPRVKLNKKGTIFIIEAPDIERIVALVDLDDPVVARQLRSLLIRKGVVREMEKLGLKAGNKVRCGNTEWEW